MRAKNRRLSCYAIFASLLLFSNGPATAREVGAISFKQTHSFFGKLVVTASNDSLRIDDKAGLGFVLVTRAPDWRVNIFRDDDKSIFTESFKEFKDSGLVSEFIVTRKGPAMLIPGAKTVTRNFMGFSIEQAHFPTNFEFLAPPRGTAKQIVVLVCSALRTFSVDGFPVTQTTVLKQDMVAGNLMKGQRQKDLSTSAINKINVDSDFFEAPKNYRKAKSVREVVAGENSREKTDNLQDLFDLDRRAN